MARLFENSDRLCSAQSRQSRTGRRCGSGFDGLLLKQSCPRLPTATNKETEVLAVAEGLDLYGKKDTARGRRSFIARYNKWSADEPGLEYQVIGRSLEARVKRGWFWGSEAFKEKLISIPENGPTRESRDFRSAVTSRDGEEKRAQEILKEGESHYGESLGELFEKHCATGRGPHWPGRCGKRHRCLTNGLRRT